MIQLKERGQEILERGGREPIAQETQLAEKGKNPFADMMTWTLRLDLPEGFGVTDIIPSLCGTFADDFRFSQVAVYFSSGGFADNDMATVKESKAGMGMVKIKEGITFLLTVDLRSTCGFLRPLLKHLGGFLIQAYMTLPLIPASAFTFGMAVVWVLPKNNFIEAGAIMFQMHYTIAPSLELEFKGKLVFKAGTDRIILECTVFVTVLPKPAWRVEGDMIGCWKKALGIPGLTLCDVGAGIGIPAEILPPNYWRIQGAMALGSGKDAMRFGVKIKADMTKPAGAAESAVLGYYLGPKTLCLEHLIQFPILFAKAAGIPGVPAVQVLPITPLCFTRVVYKESLMPLTIRTAQGEKEKFPAGKMLELDLAFFGIRYIFEAAVGIISIDIKKTLHEIRLGPIYVGGAGCDMIYKNKHDGMCVNLAISVPLAANLAKYGNPGTHMSKDKDKYKPIMPELAFGLTADLVVGSLIKMTSTIWIKPFGLLVLADYFFYIAHAKIKLTCGDPSLGVPKPTMDFKLSLNFSLTEAGVLVGNFINKYLGKFDEEVQKATKAATSSIRGTATELASGLLTHVCICGCVASCTHVCTELCARFWRVRVHARACVQLARARRVSVMRRCTPKSSLSKMRQMITQRRKHPFRSIIWTRKNLLIKFSTRSCYVMGCLMRRRSSL